ncbi:hypothetical protein [Piscinibacter defluvii]|uniref:hypothetical protein n=1 Tax=Piscinibacter defluvii TaxID=1796922 RepID=UPI000FDE4DAA|nr:hypothetical protein [Piscinibacter defluvii]
MEKAKSTWGGSRKKAGRKPLHADERTVIWSMKMSESQREKLDRLGGAPWVRERIDKAREPKE